MATYIEYGACTCGRAWNSVVPPPPCPVHGSPSTAPGLVQWAPMGVLRCAGRHCAHSPECFGYYVQT